MVGQNREGFTLTSSPTTAVNYVTGNNIDITIPDTARADGDDVRRWVIVAGTTNDPSAMVAVAEYAGYQTDQVTPTTLPATVTLSRPAHIALSATVANPAALPTGLNLVPGMRRYVTSTTYYYRYDPDSTKTANGTTVLDASPSGKWLTVPSFSVYVANTSDPNQKGCDRDIRDITDIDDIERPEYAVNGNVSIPLKYLWVQQESPTPLSLPRGTRMKTTVFVNGENKSQLFNGKLRLYFDGYVNLVDGTLDTSGMTGIGDEIIYQSRKSNLILQKELPDGYGYLLRIACAFSVFELNGEIGVNDSLEVYLTPNPQSGEYSEAAYILGEDIVYGGEGDKLLLVPAQFGVKMLSGGALVDRFSFLDNPETILTGLATDTANQKIAINGNGAMFLRTGTIPDTEALRGLVSTYPGISAPSPWSTPVTLSSGGGIQITLNYPSNGNTATIRGNYPDPKIAGLTGKAKLNAPYVRIYVENSTTGQSKYFDGYSVVDGASQTITITDWSSGTDSIYPSSPVASSADCCLFAPTSAAFIAQGIGSFPAGSTRVCFQFRYPSPNTRVSAISHDEADGCILTTTLSFISLLSSGQYWRESVQDQASLIVINSSEIVNGEHRGVVDDGKIYQFNAAATVGLKPSNLSTSDPGRWVAIGGGSSGGGIQKFADATLLRAKTSHEDGDFAYLRDGAIRKLLIFEDDSLEEDDGDYTWRPDNVSFGDPGRWRLYVPFAYPNIVTDGTDILLDPDGEVSTSPF